MKFFLLSFLFFFSGCAIIQSVSVSNVNLLHQQEKKVIGSDTVIGLLHILPLLLYEDIDVIARLKEKCSQGQVSNVQTTVVMTSFLLLQIYDIRVSANCSEK